VSYELLFGFDFDFDSDFDFCVCWIDLGRYHQSSLSLPHILKAMALAPKDVLRCLHRLAHLFALGGTASRR